MQLAHLIQILLKEPADVWRVRLVSVSDPLADLVARVRLNGHLGPVGDVGPGGGWNGQLVRSLFYSVIVRSISGLRMLFSLDSATQVCSDCLIVQTVTCMSRRIGQKIFFNQWFRNTVHNEQISFSF